jgi:hypothetical protein
MAVNKDEVDYLWKHFLFNAEQRLKAFNFFVVFSVSPMAVCSRRLTGTPTLSYLF